MGPPTASPSRARAASSPVVVVVVVVVVVAAASLDRRSLPPPRAALRAKAESDCGSYKHGGDLGFFGRQGEMHPAFETASFALRVGELSEPVWTDSGVHIILRLA